MARILIAEDDEDFAEQLALVLQSAGHEVRTCSNGKDALALLGSCSPQAILLDMRMAYTLDGLDTLRALREHPLFGQTPVLVMSALGERASGMKEETARLGGVEWTTKPLDPPQVLEWLARTLSG